MEPNQKQNRPSGKLRVNPVELLVFSLVLGVFVHSIYTLVGEEVPFQANALLPDQKRPLALTPKEKVIDGEGASLRAPASQVKNQGAEKKNDL